MMNTIMIFEKAKIKTYSGFFLGIGVAILLPFWIFSSDEFSGFNLFLFVILFPVIILAILMARKEWSLKDEKIIITESGLFVQPGIENPISWREIKQMTFIYTLRYHKLEVSVESKNINIMLDDYKHPENIADTIIKYWNQKKST